MQNNSRRPSQERTSYSYMRHPLNPIVNNEYCSRQIENNCTIDNSKYLHTQLALFQEKIVSLEMQVQKQREQNEFQQREIENYQFELEQVYINTQEKLLQQEISQEDVLFKEETINQQKSQIDTLQDKIMEMQNSYQQERLQMKQLLLNKELDNKLLYSELSKLQISQNQKQVQEEKIQLKQLQIEFNEYKMQKIKEIEKLQEQINIYQTRLSQMDHIKTEDLQNQLTTSLKELDQKRIQNQTMNQQILQLQSQNTSLNNQCNSLKEERAQLNKEKQAIETYYLDQLQKQDAQLGQMIKSSQQTVLKSQLEQKDKLIQELNIQKCNCQNTKQKMKELEQNNMTLILEVERLNNILKQKLLQLEDQDKSILQRMKQQYAEETETWKKSYQLRINNGFVNRIRAYEEQVINMNIYIYKLKMQPSEWELSIAIIGDSGVGKSTFLQMFLQGQYVARHNDKIMQCTKEVPVGQKTVKLKIIDISGKEPFRSMAWVHYRTCVGIILIFDLSSRDSFESLKKWYEEILQYVEQEKIVIRLIGNKCDKLHYDQMEATVDKHYIQFEEGEQFAATHSMNYSQTSSSSQALVDENYTSVQNIMIDFAGELLQFIHKHKENGTIDEIQGVKSLKVQVVVQEVKKKINRSSCC